LNVPVDVVAACPVPVVAEKVTVSVVEEGREKVPVIVPVDPEELVSVPVQLPPVVNVPAAAPRLPKLGVSVFSTLMVSAPLVEIDRVTSPEPFDAPFDWEENVPE